MLKHLIAYVLMTIILGVMVVSASFLANDLVENKISVSYTHLRAHET